MYEEILTRADQWIDAHRDDMVRDITRLVDIRSVSEPGVGEGPYGEGCKKVLEEMLALGTEHGFTVRNYEYHCASLSLEEGLPQNTIGLWGHLDVVPEGDGWEYEPYHATLKDGFLIGRGSQDNKGSVVGSMYVMLCLKALGVTLRHPLKLFTGCDEEHGMKDIEYYTANYPCPKLNIIPDSGFPVCYGEKGIIEIDIQSKMTLPSPLLSICGGHASNMVPDFAIAELEDTEAVRAALSTFPESFEITTEGDAIKVKAFGVSKHTAFPTGGVNAIHLLTTALANTKLFHGEFNKVLELYNRINLDFFGNGIGIACADDISGELTCVGSVLRCVDGKTSLNLNIRYPIKADSEKLLARLDEVSEQYACKACLGRNSKPNYFDPSNPIVKKLVEVYNAETGAQGSAFVMGGGTYARKLPNAFAYGHGLPDSRAEFLKPQHGGGHEPDEALNIDQLLKAMKIYVRALLAIDEYEI